MKEAPAARAARLLELHDAPELLILPNVWDPLGARMLESLGYPAVATASAAVAYSLGYRDGEAMPFEEMLGAIRRVARAVDVPVTADVERGYSDTPEGVADNTARVIEAGAVGVNVEDSLAEGGDLRDVDGQCERIAAARGAADAASVPLVINARIDVFMSQPNNSAEARLEETIVRSRHYLSAGADCIYPITLNDLGLLKKLREAIAAPINVYASPGTPPVPDLEAAGIARLSLGPGLLKVSVSAMKRVAEELREGGSYDALTSGVISSQEIEDYLTTSS